MAAAHRSKKSALVESTKPRKNGPRSESHIHIDPAKLMRELNRRGLTAAGFARRAKLSAPTMSRLLNHGSAVSPATARRITEALRLLPPIEGLDALLKESA